VSSNDPAVLMRFPPYKGPWRDWEGEWFISRITTHDQLQAAEGNADRWPAIKAGDVVMFQLHGPVPGNYTPLCMVVIADYGTPVVDPSIDSVQLIGSRDESDMEWTLPFWMSFFEALIWPPDFQWIGHWAGMRLPFWLPSVVFERATEQYTERMESSLTRLVGQLKSTVSEIEQVLLTRRRDELARRIVRYVFDGFQMTARDGLEDVLLDRSANGYRVGKTAHFTSTPSWPTLECDHMYGTWHIMVRGGSGFGSYSLASTLRQVHGNWMGPLISESDRERWEASNIRAGVPFLEPERLELYDLLGTESPLLLPHEAFLEWYRTETSP
jgi:hypothetical protein